MTSPLIVVLGDSRVFDTYYASEEYEGRTYGYQATFPHRLALARPKLAGVVSDVVHIPDHFRGRTLANNILRLALTDPDVVILCDGIWETLISPRMVADALNAEVASLDPELVVGLYTTERLALAPRAYAERVATIVSWFMRRRRTVIWLDIPVPPPDHFGGLHHAGNYRPVPGWHACVRHLNEVVSREVRAAGGLVLSLGAAMNAHGGAACCLIDQWHFSAAFHGVVAGMLVDLCATLPGPLPDDHVSREVMIAGRRPRERVVLLGPRDDRKAFRTRYPDVDVGAEVDQDSRPPKGSRVVVLVSPEATAASTTASLFASTLDRDAIVLLSSDLGPLTNPSTGDRASFGGFK